MGKALVSRRGDGKTYVSGSFTNTNASTSSITIAEAIGYPNIMLLATGENNDSTVIAASYIDGVFECTSGNHSVWGSGLWYKDTGVFYAQNGRWSNYTYNFIAW